MKNILVSNTAWKELHKLKRILNLRNANQVIELLIKQNKDEGLNNYIKDLFEV